MAQLNSPLQPLDSKRHWVKALQLEQVRRRLTYADWAQAERDCEVLAGRLLEAYPREALRAFSFVALPRGGLVVAGLLAYILDLAPGQLAEPALRPDAPLCIVDDCALTGYRFSQALARFANEHVAFAHLYSHPDLRRGILDKEPRVRCCAAARDLETLDPGAAPPVEARAAPPHTLGFSGYWSGSAAPVAFPWSEPTVHVRDPFTGAVETHWRFAPPHLCLKNKTELGLPPDPGAMRAWRPAAGVVMGEADGVTWVIQTAEGRTYAFEGLEADMWRGLAAYGSLDASAAQLEARCGMPVAALRSRLEGFAARLAGAGLLEPA